MQCNFTAWQCRGQIYQLIYCFSWQRRRANPKAIGRIYSREGGANARWSWSHWPARCTALFRIEHLQSFNCHLVKLNDHKGNGCSAEMGMYSLFMLLQAQTNNWSRSILLSFLSEITWLLNSIRSILVSCSTQDHMLCAAFGETHSSDWSVQTSSTAEPNLSREAGVTQITAIWTICLKHKQASWDSRSS